MPHLLLTSALLFALLAIVGVAIGASMRIARDLLLDESDEERQEPGGDGRISVPEDFGVGLRHAATFAPARGGSLPGGRSRDTGI